MGLFSKKKEGLFAFANGRTVDITNVPDEVFSTKMMGDGIAIIPEDGTIYAPCKGEVTMVMAPSNHAVGIELKNGMEILIHTGLETVTLMGEGFTPIVKVGDKVDVGDVLLNFDLDFIKEKGLDPITMMVITNMADKKIKDKTVDEAVSKGSSKIIELA